MPPEYPVFMPAETAEGDFYMSDPHECLSCGVPQVEAPTLVGWMESRNEVKHYPCQADTFTHCCWIRQPENWQETLQAIRVLNGQELDCHRYRGTNREIISQISGDVCDHRSVRRTDHHPSPIAYGLTLPDRAEGFVARVKRWLRLK